MRWEHAVRTRRDVSTLRLRGQLDRSGADALHRTLVEEVLRDGVAVVRLDLRGVRFLGASAAAALVAASFAGRAAGRRMIVGACSDEARESLDRTGAAQVMGPAAGVTTGSAALRRPRRFAGRRREPAEAGGAR
ncbi:hypothetical protein GCM10020358_34150 [Amorphoplanes nipponensis]|uniref:STAS domain-containing protein n=1 Tax=Actinoplanes nipponensis TaxID=135950 RepID=A0A919MP39_9ACTN|nr:STAS domain-containing protein [Actinoplanes nipponensis]GIE49113.1 hypothetical protein Ani05nite_26470 [Actinoplanes nipponensis]